MVRTASLGCLGHTGVGSATPAVSGCHFMIVTCSSCHARFRVPDGRIGPKGARIRCSRCGTVFAAAGAPAAVESSAEVAAPPRPSLPTQPGPPPGGLAGPPAFPPAPAFEIPLDDPFAPHLSARPPEPDPFAAPVVSKSPAASSAQALASAPPGGPTGSFPLPDDAPSAVGAGENGGPDGELGGDWDPFGITPKEAGAGQAVGELALQGDSLVDTLALEERPAPRPTSPPAVDSGAALQLPGPNASDPFVTADLVGVEPSLTPDGTGASELLPPPDAAEPLAAAQSVAEPVTGLEEIPPREVVVQTPRRRAQRVGAAVASAISLAILAAAAVGLFMAGRVELARHLPWLRRTDPGPVEVTELRGGLYETAGGGTVLVVRGRVVARRAMNGPVSVRVELVRDERPVAKASTLAGAEATPEQVFGAETPEKVAALTRNLDEHAATGLAKGGTVPFLVLFAPPIPELRGAALRAVAEGLSAR